MMFIKGYPKFRYISKNLNNNVKDISIEKDVNTLFTYLIPLLNDGTYQRFNSHDYYVKSSNIKENDGRRICLLTIWNREMMNRNIIIYIK